MCTPLQIVAGCWLPLRLLLLAAAAAAGCCWLLLRLLLLLAAGCWLLAAAGCCCCWLLQLIAGICRNKENANCRNGPLLIQGIYDLRATCARLARKFSNLPDSFDHADDDDDDDDEEEDDDDDDESSLRHLRFTCALLARPHV